MKRGLICVVLVTGLVWTVRAQTPRVVIRMDPALDAIIPPAARLEVLVRDRFGASEGPVWVADGQYLLFTDIRAKPGDPAHGGRIHKWSADGNLSVYLEPSGGANGLALDPEGRVVMCADEAVVRLERDGTQTTLADRFEGKPFNGPNDVAVRSDGSVYFSDYGSRPDLPSGIYRWKDGVVQRGARNVQGGRVNGIALSPDGRSLYAVAVPEGVPRRIARFTVRPDGTLADERLFFALPVEKILATRESGRPDGVKADAKGNVYFGGPGGLLIVSPDGKHLGTIVIEGGHTNLAFGDADRKGLYLTTGHGLARIRLNAPAL